MNRPSSDDRRAASPTVLLASEVPNLPPTERRIAEGILQDPDAVAYTTISELAEATGASTATIVRMARRLGFAGYRDFRIAIATEVGRAQGRDAPLTGIAIAPTDDLRTLVDKVAAADVKAIRDTIDGLDLVALSAAVKAVSGARRILLIGVGAAGLVALDLRDKLYRIGKDVTAATDRHAGLTGAVMLTNQDVALGISHSGVTEDVLEPMAASRETGATSIALTNYRSSPLAELADVVVTTAVADSALRARSMASRAAMMTVVDCLFIGSVQTNYHAALHALEVTSQALEGTGHRPPGDRA